MAPLDFNSTRSKVAATFGIAGALLLCSGLSTAPASASVTIGNLAPGPIPGASCDGPSEFVQASETGANPYVVPPNGAEITSWSTQANDQPMQLVELKIYRPISGFSYQAVAHDGPFVLTPEQVNMFATSVAVQPGEVIGIGAAQGAQNVACTFGGGAGQVLVNPSNTADGGSVTFSPVANPTILVNISAQVAPKASNDITLGKLSLHKRTGTATLAVAVPGPGTLSLGGAGVVHQRRARAAAAVFNRTVTKAGTVKLPVKAKGAKKAKLNSTGAVKLKVKVTFTPAASGGSVAGDPNTETKTVKLVKK